ncbi:MAG: hypothetical protein IJC02_13370 [Lachnospiraceae bacterium]|nr:hypothetical protein [Lachnospiraceae bacterium]MBQ6996512.1 hypothetical protein [Lachnospiraceae bacterium]
MRKFFGMIMSVMMVLTLVCVPVQATEAEPTMWDDILQVEVPELSDTVWYFTGACLDGVELTQEEYDATLEAYGGVLNFVFDAEGNAWMQQGEGELEGAYEYFEEEETIVVVFENGEELLTYICAFTETEENEIVLLAFPAEDETLENCIYFMNAEDIVIEAE